MIKGQFGKLNGFADTLKNLDAPLEKISANMAEEAIELIREGFDKQQDPDGRQWAGLKLRKGKILQDTGGLRSSWHRVRATKKGFLVRSGKLYSSYHQGGTGIYGPRKQRIKPIRAKALKLGKYGFAASIAGVPKRRMVPENGRIPVHWDARFRKIANQVLARVFR